MVVVKIELWPHGEESQKRDLGCLVISNDGTGDEKVSNYDVTASHAGIFFGKRKEPFKRGKVVGFMRNLSPYRLVSRALKAIGET